MQSCAAGAVALVHAAIAASASSVTKSVLRMKDSAWGESGG